jgi:hypothetical protein
VRCCPKITRDIFVACFASFRAHEFRARNTWWRENSAISRRAARKKDEGQCCSTAEDPEKFVAFTADPSSKPRLQHGRSVDRAQLVDNAFLRKKFSRDFSLACRALPLRSNYSSEIAVARQTAAFALSKFCKAKAN